MKTLSVTAISLVLVTRPAGSRIARQRQVIDFVLSDRAEIALTRVMIVLAVLAMIIEEDMDRFGESIARTIEYWSFVIWFYWTGARLLCSSVVVGN